MSKNILLIICAKASKKRLVLNELSELLGKYAEVSYKVVHIKTPPELKPSLKNIDIAKFSVVAVFGGDGTVVAAFKVFQDTKTPIVIIPGGTANILARYFNVPAGVSACLELYLSNLYVTRLVDIASVNGNPLVLDIHAGLWTEAITTTSTDLKRRFGPAAYAWSTLRIAKNAPLQTYKFVIDNNPPKTIKGYTFLVVNQGKHNVLGLPMFRRDHAPGMLQIAVIKSIKPHMLIVWFFYKLFTFRNLGSVVQTFVCKELIIQKTPYKMLADDSERQLAPPIVVQGSHSGVRVVAPPVQTSTRMLRRVLLKSQLFLLRIWQRIRVFSGIGPSERYSHVAPGIYLGGKVSARVSRRFVKWGVTGVISMRTTKPPVLPGKVETLWLPTKDWTPPSVKDFEKGVEFINKHLANKGSVYIHCQLGEGRGPSMAAAYLIAQGLSVEEAIEILVKYRPVVQPNTKQLKRLVEWQEAYNKLN